MISSGAISVRIGMLPEMNTTEPYSPTARANASAKPVSSAGQDRRQDHARERLPRLAPEAGGGLLDFRSRSSSTGCTRPDHERKPMKVSATTMPSGVNAT